MTNTARPDADAWLVDDRWSKAYPLSDETHIGRGMGASIILRDPVISRRHATVVKEGDTYVLHCYGAAGTQVNGQPVESTHVLVEGDKIEIAYTRLRYTCMAPTGEMFIMTRDQPTTIDQNEGPTRATVKAVIVNRATFWRKHSALLVVAGILLLLILYFFSAGTAPR